ncbi:transcription factor p65 isoform X2 [Hyposmocoma kahamanoa]|uniref:transcription factor p65 isoform X2 n=1 Tax=Hyposmocoma kahamanoa TaxID=1477025 RepID=UPI000E6D839C|nr:transcription factor p65 isoform X2 [Hyposmocoma kahamanoa]
MEYLLSAKYPYRVVWSPKYEDISPASSYDGGLSPGVLDQNDGEADAPLNFSDVLEAIEQADPSYGGVVLAGDAGGAVLEEVMARPAPVQGGPFVRIVEQPASRALRFRYECEGRSAGSIPGVNSTQDRRTYPTIEICGHTGKAIVVVSCVTKESPYKPHPHNLVGRDRCQRGVCTQRVDVTADNRLVTFSNLGIQCVKRRDIAEALRVREELRVDPFRTGYAHRNQPQSIDLNAVRLCFQVFLPDEAGKVRHSLEPVVSEIIYDKKAMTDLQILRISRSSGSARGGTELILLCEKVTREDVAVVLYEERREVGAGGGGASCVVWEDNATVVMVHKQAAIAFTTPPYRDPATGQHVDVFIQLKRPSDGTRSVGVPFTYIPELQDTKRRKMLNSALLRTIDQERSQWGQERKPIKSEPSDKSPMHMTSPHHVFPPIEQVPDNSYQIQRWVQEAMNVPGPSGLGYQFGPELAWPSPAYAAVSPPAMAHSPGMLSPQAQVMSPQQAMSPQHVRVMSPHEQVLSPQGQVLSPQGQVLSPQGQVLSPQGQVMSPQGQVLSPGPTLTPLQGLPPMLGPQMDARCGMGHVSPTVGHVSPNLGNVSPHMMQQPLPQVQDMETNSASLTNLLNQGAELAQIQLNSEELSGLLNYPNSRPHELTDSFHQLSTLDRM